uniref:Peptidase S1 domain-containing protein n=1 Tax=Panagrolaimus superbus TaxID=310955 RepID=A0A914Z6I9_9BILA
MKTFTFLFFVTFICCLIFEGGKAQQCGIGTAAAIYENYFWDRYDTEKIIGGHALTDGAFPWVVSLKISYSDGRAPGGCTGTVISSNYILTAKHCTEILNLESIEIFYGSANRQRMISQIYSAAFNSPGIKTFGEDIALIKLKTPIEFSENVNPICLSRNLRPNLGEKAIVAGFGYVFNGVINGANEGDEVEEQDMNINLPNTLNAVKVDITEDNKCNCNFAAGVQSDTELCAGGLLQGTLQGDSGGPLMILEKNSKLWYQIGITARGQTYATNDTLQVVDYGIYTDVSKFCDWIEKTTNNDVICES